LLHRITGTRWSICDELEAMSGLVFKERAIYPSIDGAVLRDFGMRGAAGFGKSGLASGWQ
jgi:hypothetical protein